MSAPPSSQYPHTRFAPSPALPHVPVSSIASAVPSPHQASSTSMTGHPAPTPAPPADPVAAALLAFHRQLVAYYWLYAQQGYVAPLTATVGTDEHVRQLAARTEAVEWARQCGITVVDPQGSHVGTAGANETQGIGQQGAEAVPHGQRTNGRPLPPAPSRSTVPPLQPSVPGPAAMPRDVHVPLNRDMVVIGASHAHPAQSASFPQSTASPSPAQAAQTVSFLLDSGARNTTIPAVHFAPPPASTAPPSSSSTGKRPLPLPPRPSASADSTAQPSASDAADQLAGLSLAERPDSAKETSAAPAVPSFSFDGPDEDDAPSPPPAKPPIPSFSFVSDDDDEASTSSLIPTFSFGEDDALASTLSRVDARPRPPPVHPRYDPSHPSHTLYHPTSGGHALPEAGSIVCTACRQAIFGRVLVALGRQWHPDCFRCAEEGCGARLEVMEFEGTPEDWEDEEATSDEDGVEGERSGLKGKAWCMVHFEEVREAEQAPCSSLADASLFPQRFALECHHCRTPIASADYIPVSDPSLPPRPDYRHHSTRYYHPLHFFCAGCGDPFIDPVAYESRYATSPPVEARPYVPREGHPYCDSCDLRMWRPKCPGCKEGLREEDGFLEVEGAGRWHEGCFKCSVRSNQTNQKSMVVGES